LLWFWSLCFWLAAVLPFRLVLNPALITFQLLVGWPGSVPATTETIL
jgi:hypothetical protein